MMAASTGSNTFYARPVYVSGSRNDAPRSSSRNDAPRVSSRNDAARAGSRNDASRAGSRNDASHAVSRNDAARVVSRNDASRAGSRNDAPRAGSRNDASHAYCSHTSNEPKASKSVTTAAIPTKIISRRFSEIEDSSPPPRPPPPRPSRVAKKPENNSVSSLPPYKHGEQNSPQYQHRERNSLRQNLTTPEPKPLTRVNITSHDQIWQKDEDSVPSGRSDILSPPMKYITPQVTEEMWKNYDPLDGIDSMSDHSDASVDTMIMMTTEEEMKNKEKINDSLKEYTSVKSKGPGQITNTNKLKDNIQSKKTLHIHFADTNGMVNVWTPVVSKGISRSDQQTLSTVSPLHIKTDNDDNGYSPESVKNKTNSNQGSPNDDSPDDGYGTNSSSGTVSSPFSSSFGSYATTDLENSRNGNSKNVILPNGAIKPNSVRESWAVKRKQRMIDAQDNSVQEQLRQLTIIEEEGSANALENSRIPQRHADNFQQGKNGHGVNVSGRDKEKTEDNKHPKSVLKNGNLPNANSGTNNYDLPFVNVSQNDLEHRNRQLYVINGETDTRPSAVVRADGMNQPQISTATSEINSAPARVPPPHSQDYTYATVRARDYTYATVRARDRNGERVLVSGRTMEVSDSMAASEDSDFPSLPENNGPLMLIGGSENPLPTLSGSGKIYVSPNGDEGFYSLNRSSRSTSVSSFQPIGEVTENNLETQNTPRSPLEALSGDLLEKWSDMDRNYRNYYGFDDQEEKYCRTDSKINYFQEKKINNMYGQDNYYRPPNYGPDPGNSHISGQESTNQGTRSRDSSLDRHVAPPAEPDTSSKTSTMRSTKSSKESGSSKSSKEPGSSKSKLFQILPSMFRPSGKKQNADSKSNKRKQKEVQGLVLVETTPSVADKHRSLILEPEGDIYVNLGDLPQYSLANIEYEEKLKKGQFVSLENLHKRPVFASSKDIQKLFSKHDQSFDSINHPGGQRHSFHAMPLSYRHVNAGSSSVEDMRPRAQSTSATMRSQQLKNSVESRMSVISRKNAAVMNEAQMSSAASIGNLSLHSSARGSGGSVTGSRTRLDSGSSGGDSKLSTLV